MAHASLSPLLLMVAVQRLGALWLLRPGGFFYDFTDYYTYWQYARVLGEGFWPYRDFWLEYPPLFPLLNQALYALSLHFPPLPDARFWHHFLLGLVLLPFDLGVIILLQKLMGRVWGVARGEWVVAAWALLFAPLFLWQSFFDVLPLFGLLLAVWAMGERRPVWAGVGLAFGFLTKLLSLLALPAALWLFARRAHGWRGLLSKENGQMLGTFALLVALVVGPLLLIGPEWLLATVQNFGGRGAWQTVWALVDGNLNYGQVLGDRFDPTPAFVETPTRVPWLLIHALFGAAGLALWLRRWRWEQPGVQVAFVAATVFLFFLWSKGWSPQFTLMLLPWLLLLLPDGRGLALALFLTALMAWETLYYGFVVYRAEAPWMLVTIILLRTATLVALTLLAIARLRQMSVVSNQ